MWDAFPVSNGHALVIPKRHIPTWFDATLEEQASLLAGIQEARRHIDARFKPHGYNIGINVSESGGQTVNHMHIHVIPRYRGDVRDPRGGVRHVIPQRGNYLSLGKDAEDDTGEYRAQYDLPRIFGSKDKPLLKALGDDIAVASSFDIAVAFITRSGLAQLSPHLIELLQRGGRSRVLTGDYLGVTEPEALYQLNDWIEEYPEQFRTRIFQTDSQIGFHPKAYVLHHDYTGVVAYIGSSNLTRHALTAGIEWNQKISGSFSQLDVSFIIGEFEALFSHTQTIDLTPSWIKKYAARRPAISRSKAEAAIDRSQEETETPPEPHAAQAMALAALQETRLNGNAAGLVVMATGLGKTWLAAFDSIRFDRVLFVAHREEILHQAMATFRLIRPDANLGYYLGGTHEKDADVLFASIQTLSRQNHLDVFDPTRFDYIIVDEFHHAAAKTYRRLIDHFVPAFLLGLTATPERTDGGDLLALCGENLIYRCDLIDGINQGLLSPFRYFGVPDEIDFTNIPWRSGRFDPEKLEFAVATDKRAESALRQWKKRAQTRTLAFCVSQRHADHMANYFLSNGVTAVSVHSGPSSASRAKSLEQLETGDIQVVFAVDMFNEGVDVPAIDTVLMLRPTESKILWLQQFGRGLRKSENKSHLAVIDYIGNHRSFLQVPSLLLPEAGSKPGEIHRALMKLERGELELPVGCHIEYELEAINILKQLSRPVSVSEQMTHWYRTFRELNSRRPSAVEAFHEGYDPKSVRSTFGSWLAFVRSEGDLSGLSSEAFDIHREFLEQLEKTQMTRSYKMLVLQAMLAHGSFPGSISIDQLVSTVQERAGRLALLRQDFGDALNDRSELKKLLEDNPINAWIGGRGTGGRSHFSYNGKSFSSFDADSKHASHLSEMVEEIVDWRIAQYLERIPGQVSDEPIGKNQTGRTLWKEYMREEIPGIWGLEFSAAKWNQGFVREGPQIFLLVSLDKSGMTDAYQYEDKFLSETEFQWLSQNRTTRSSKVGRSLKNHASEGLSVHLFVRDRRKTPKGTAAPFIYCGDVSFKSWNGDQPITIRWQLPEPLPSTLAVRFGLGN